MPAFPGSPRLLKGGLVTMDPDSGAVLKVIPLQYNPASLSRTLQAQTVAGERQDRSDPLRLVGPAIETLKVEIEIDATDQLEFPDQNPNTVRFGIAPQLAQLETLVYPLSSQLAINDQLAQSGNLEIIPMEAPLTLFVWSRNRILPVRLTDFSITEEAFDPNLNPIQAKVSLGMRVLSVNDLNYEHKGNSLFMAYLQQKEGLAALAGSGGLGALGLSGIG